MISATLLCFLGASVAFTLAPGPDTTCIVAQGVSRGRKAAIFTALGMCSGVSVHTTAAALGISAALTSCAALFTLLKWAGAAYLLFLAWKAVREPGGILPQTVAAAPGAWAYFRRGFLMNVINPKVALFFLAFLPQFVVPGSGGMGAQMFWLGLVFMLQAVVVLSGIAVLAGSVGEALQRNPGVARGFAWLTAGIFAALGLRLVFAQR